ncbi:MAG: hypothetical protein WC217_00960 [Candidatus Paceibacterota bacterium]|jgi:hypothetical protein
MYEPVADARFVNVARFWVGYLEVVVAAMVVRAYRKVLMQSQNIPH